MRHRRIFERDELDIEKENEAKSENLKQKYPHYRDAWRNQYAYQYGKKKDDDDNDTERVLEQ